eukprot:TRINITY_DN219_c0_g1_i4.p1 TRINITY_DN219_c0_g1~~TRINITY_DN219_c0_g1_i4.p1  ORF type:complete len:622 (+),score=118.28 TRINITY_DN219_c0_g1_i4:38-1867(+)
MKQLLLLFVLVLVRADEDPCKTYRTCNACLYNSDTSCGWCGLLGRCLTGNETGPLNITDCQDEKNKNSTYTGWEWTTSKILSYDPINSQYEVFLRPGVPLVVPLSITVPFIPPLDFFFLQDASVSMKPYVTNIISLLPNITAALEDLTKNVSASYSIDPVVYGLGAFLEKPISPFANWPESFVYKTIKSLTKNSTDLLGVLNNFLIGGLSINYEHPEDLFEGIVLAARGGVKGELPIGWRNGAFHICFVITDATSHVAGDGGKLLGIYQPNNLDNVMDGFPPGTAEDYPSVEDVKKVLIDTDVNPIIAAVGKVIDWHQDVVKNWGLGAAIQISPDPSALINAILDGTAEVFKKVVLGLQLDSYGRVIMIVPNNNITIKDGYYNPVSRNQVLPFNVTLLLNEEDTEMFGVESNTTADIIYKYVGFGYQIRIRTHSAIQCRGCDPDNETLKADVCGICGGNGSTCIGCDGIIGSVFQYDICGVCGGNGRSCLGCDGIPNGAQFDECGECGGNNQTCLGCDGVPNSGLEKNSCGECGGNPNCQALTATIIALSSVAAVGIIAAAIGLVAFIGAGAAMMKADQVMVEKETHLKVSPLYEEAKKKFDNPLLKHT